MSLGRSKIFAGHDTAGWGADARDASVSADPNRPAGGRTGFVLPLAPRRLFVFRLVVLLVGRPGVCRRPRPALDKDRRTSQPAVRGFAEQFDLLLGRIEHAAAVLDEEVAPLV